ncbi:MAG: WD40 repeat domain-containing protein [Nitrospira sp.]|nr:WD40 repeat domain-containing protein [Nitrospira sp.]
MCLARAINRLNETTTMNRWDLYQKIVRVLLVVAPVLAISSIEDAAGFPTKTLTAFSEDGRLLLVQADELVVWDLEAKALVAKIPGLHCQQIALLKQEGWVLCVEHSVAIYDWKNQAVVATIPAESREPYRLLAYSSETDRMILRHGNEAVSVWQLGKKLIPLRHIALDVRKDVTSMAASPDTKLLAIAQGHTIHLHDLTSTTIRDLAIEGGRPRDLLFAPDSSHLAASAGKAILLIDPVEASIAARATLTNAEGAQGSLTPETFSRDGHRVVAANGEWSYALFNADTGELITLTEFTYAAPGRGMRSPTQLRAVDIAAEADLLVGQPEHLHTLQIWDLQAGAMLPDLCGEDCRNGAPQVSLLKWSPTGSKIVIGMQGGLNHDVDGKISVWDVASRSPELVLDPSQPQAKVLAKRSTPPTFITTIPSPSAAPAFVHARALRAVATSPSANLLVTCGDDGLLKLWDPGQGTLLRQLALPAPATALAFSADGAILAVGTLEGDVRLWETQTWREFSPYSSRQGRINALQFIPGNRLLVVAGEHPNVPVVDLVTRTVVRELVHAGRSSACVETNCEKNRALRGEVVNSLSFLDGSSFLLTISESGRVVWDISTWRVVEKPAGIPEGWSGLGWKQPLVWTTTRSSGPKAFTLAVWDTKHNKVLANLDAFTKRDTEIDHGPPVVLGTSMAVDPLQRWAATRVGEHISVWDLPAQAKRKTFHVKTPYDLYWTSDGKHLIVATLDRKILVWSAETMEPAHYLRDPSVTR